MNHRSASLKEKARAVVSVLLAIAAIEFLFSCDQSNDPSKNKECGTGHVQWDSKGSVCRDLGGGVIVPASCCGH